MTGDLPPQLPAAPDHPLRSGILHQSSVCCGTAPDAPCLPMGHPCGTDTRPGLQGANWPPPPGAAGGGCWAAQVWGTEASSDSLSKTVWTHPSQMPPRPPGKYLLSWKEDNGLLGLLLTSRRSGQKVRRYGLSPGPTARFLCHCGWAAVPL